MLPFIATDDMRKGNHLSYMDAISIELHCSWGHAASLDLASESSPLVTTAGALPSPDVSDLGGENIEA